MAELDLKKIEELEQKFDSGLHTRAIGPWLIKFTFLFSIAFAAYHYITAGIGVPVDYWHMGFHMSGVILLVFIGFPAIRGRHSWELHANSWWRFGNVPIWDWLFIVVGVGSEPKDEEITGEIRTLGVLERAAKAKEDQDAYYYESKRARYRKRHILDDFGIRPGMELVSINGVPAAAFLPGKQTIHLDVLDVDLE